MVSSNRLKPYAIYDSVYDLQHTELYSGGELDPVVDAKIYAEENLAFDNSGYRLPFSTQVGLNAQYLDRNKNILEDMEKKVVRVTQKVTVTIIVWNCIEDYLFYESDESSWGEFI